MVYKYVGVVSNICIFGTYDCEKLYYWLVTHVPVRVIVVPNIWCGSFRRRGHCRPISLISLFKLIVAYGCNGFVDRNYIHLGMDM